MPTRRTIRAVLTSAALLLALAANPWLRPVPTAFAQDDESEDAEESFDDEEAGDGAFSEDSESVDADIESAPEDSSASNAVEDSSDPDLDAAWADEAGTDGGGDTAAESANSAADGDVVEESAAGPDPEAAATAQAEAQPAADAVNDRATAAPVPQPAAATAPPADSNEPVDTTEYKVVVNHEEQYSIWPAQRENALGWRDAGKSGSKAECLAWIRDVWTDMRPLSLRKRMEEAAKTNGDH
jgi:MbtH protein